MRPARILVDKYALRMAKCGTIIFYVLVWITSSSAGASRVDFYSKNLPPQVVLGMTPDQLVQVRRGVRTNELIQPNYTEGKSVTMVELLRMQNQATALWYRFKEDKLGAVSRSVSTKNLPSESAQASASEMHRELLENFTLVRQEEVLRSTGATTFEVSAQLWEDKANGLNIYFIATSQEITIIIFEPTSFSSRDFFVPVNKREEIDAHAKSVQDIVGESTLTPLPIVDFLPTVKNEGTSKARTVKRSPPRKTRPVSPRSTPVTQKISVPPSSTPPETRTASYHIPIELVLILAAVIAGLVTFLLRSQYNKPH